ncbi:GNAT family N-acetyltransferase [Peribacillus acanthi]|uniref:GNAT family N-acetyltransferase n=1 Tax=Peribacillus acanthi TaxID=2171554 RepID=UPI000D3E85E0|nr:GNAT family N-acetyltransferase [Peribacillus acanthi]
MIIELQLEQHNLVEPLLVGLEDHPVINGVIAGNNRGRVFVNHSETPTTTFIWANNEMYYLIGNAEDQEFNGMLEGFIIETIKPEALQIGETDLNLEVFPSSEWFKKVIEMFNGKLNIGERVPFIFKKENFVEASMGIPGYDLLEINRTLFEKRLDYQGVITHEILKFWETLDDFLVKGIGYCVIKNQEVIGTCLSVFVSENEYEIGINTYSTEHRGKGIATSMATAFISKCLCLGGTPHWTTEHFRKDSIVIANKLGFEQLPNYKVFYLPFEELNFALEER